MTTCRLGAAIALALAPAACKTPDTAVPSATLNEVSGAQGGDGGEEIPAGETEATLTIAKIIGMGVQMKADAGESPSRRDAHAKHHGCVKADVVVEKDLPPELRVGVFAQKPSYGAWIRFSNGSGKVQDDHIGDGRGMAIKLVGVSGTKVLESEQNATTQDFLMINHPVFFVRNGIDYVDFTKASAQGNPLAFFATHQAEGAIAGAISARKVGNMLDHRYFTMAPIRMGERFAKVAARPVSCSDGSPVTDNPAGATAPGDDYLRLGMIERLGQTDACFKLGVQLQTEPSTMPVEDATVEWSEAVSPYVDVATITIKKQKFDSKAQQTFCEHLSLTPWHSLPEHKPAGGINRVRRVVYETIANLRHKLNNVPRTEPTGNEKF